MEERPLECSGCKKTAEIAYQEIVGAETTKIHMCADCPVLKRKLDGTGDDPFSPKIEEELCCSQCKTTLESVLLGSPLGCKNCYTIFQDVLTDQLTELNQIAPKLRPSKRSKGLTFHVGKNPEVDPSDHKATRLSALNEALSEALNGEDYEQAAWVRDQINTLVGNEDGKS